MIMTPFGRRWRVVSLFVVVAWLLGSFIQSHNAYAERKRVSGTGVGTLQGQTEIWIPMGDMNAQVGFLRMRLWVYSSSDPAWNNAKGYAVVFINVLAKSLKGFTVVAHQGGDQTFLEYEGTVEVEPDVSFTAQIQGRFLSGTGKFKGITGKWTSTIRGESAEER